MKTTVLSLIFTSLALVLTASDGFNVRYSQPDGNAHQLVYTTGDYGVSQVVLQGNTYSMIEFEGKIVTTRKGFAELPYLNATVMIDPERNVTLTVVPGDYTDIPLDHPLVPSRGVIYRNQDPAAIPYQIDPKSVTDSWYPVDLATGTDPFILRDIRGTSIYAYPFQYNAARQVLRVYHTLTVDLVENETPAINPLHKAPVSIVREMDAVYRSVFINYETVGRDNLTIGEFGDIHVITTARDETAVQPYIDWKREKGYNVSVEVVPVNTVVNANVQAAYNSNNNILYVLLVGDWADLKCTTTGAGRPMDPQVGCVVGTDDFADISVGRLSANSPGDVTVQVDKIINYEKNPETGGEWYASATGIASNEGAGAGDDGESDIQHNNVIWNNKLDPFTYDNFYQVYDPGATISMVNNAVNTGTGVINYTGHGWGEGWGTTGFSNSNVSGLTNGNKLPFIISVACNNGDFDLGTCFAEAWLRKQNGGAVMFLGGSISQPWSPPMRGQDYFMDVLIGGYDYTAHPGQNGISTTEQRTTLGSIVFNGLTLMCVESGSSSDWETAKTWNLFGDPALQARTAAPAQIVLSNTLIMVGVPFTTTVTGPGGPVANAMVALSQDGVYYRGITDAAGSVTIEQSLNPGTAKLVVTGFNTATIYEDVNVIPPNGPYVMVSSVEINDAAGNGNGQLDYGETVLLTIGLTNVGTADATNVTATLATTDDYVTVLDNQATYGTIPSGDTVFVADGFEIAAGEDIPDLHMAIFNFIATGSTRDSWTSTFTLTGHAPLLQMDSYTIDDAAGNNNGRLDPGETAIIHITAKNAGSADAYNLTGDLATESTFISILNTPVAGGDLPAGQTAILSFDIEIDEATPAGHAPLFTLNLAADMNITGYGEFVEYVGQIPVLLIDWDGNHNSPDVIAQCLANLEVGFDRVTQFPEDLNLYTSIFVCLGVYSDNHVLTAEEGQVLANYLDNGGNLYMEGADTWYYDQTFTPTPVHPMFNIAGLEDGTGDLNTQNGQPGSICEEMSFGYTGENSYIDHLGAVPPALMMFMNNQPAYGTAVTFDAGTYKTIGASFEFGGLQDGERTKDDLMIQYLEFFGIQGIWTSTPERKEATLVAGSYPNPFRDETVIRFESGARSRAVLEVYNVSGQLIRTLLNENVDTGTHEIRWDGKAGQGAQAPDGLYFYRLQLGGTVATGKMVKM